MREKYDCGHCAKRKDKKNHRNNARCRDNRWQKRRRIQCQVLLVFLLVILLILLGLYLRSEEDEEEEEGVPSQEPPHKLNNIFATKGSCVCTEFKVSCSGIDNDAGSYVSNVLSKNCSTCTELYIEKSAFINRALQVGWLWGLKHSLLKLEINNCNLEKIYEGSFDDAIFENLNVLVFQNFPVKELTNGIFKGLRQLHTLQINDNLSFKYVQPGILERLEHLQVLTIENSIGESVLANFTKSASSNIHTVSIQANHIPYIEANTLSGLKGVKLLYIKVSRVQKIHPDALKLSSELEVLDLSLNEITHLSLGLFDNAKKLVNLFLNHNHLSTLAENIFEKITGRLSLHISDNPWNCTCELAWLQRLANEGQIILDYPQCTHPEDEANNLLINVNFSYCNENITTVSGPTFSTSTTTPSYNGSSIFTIPPEVSSTTPTTSQLTEESTTDFSTSTLQSTTDSSTSTLQSTTDSSTSTLQSTTSSTSTLQSTTDSSTSTLQSTTDSSTSTLQSTTSSTSTLQSTTSSTSTLQSTTDSSTSTLQSTTDSSTSTLQSTTSSTSTLQSTTDSSTSTLQSTTTSSTSTEQISTFSTESSTTASSFVTTTSESTTTIYYSNVSCICDGEYCDHTFAIAIGEACINCYQPFRRRLFSMSFIRTNVFMINQKDSKLEVGVTSMDEMTLLLIERSSQNITCYYKILKESRVSTCECRYCATFDVKPATTYTVCLIPTSKEAYSPLDCQAYTTMPRREDQPWLLRREIPWVLTICVLIFVFIGGLGATFSYFLVQRHPSLIKGNKRVVVVGHHAADIMVMPKEYALPRHGQYIRRHSIVSCETIGTSSISYVDPNEPSPVQLIAWRFNRMWDRLKLSENSNDLSASTDPPPLPPHPKQKKISSISWDLVAAQESSNYTTVLPH